MERLGANLSTNLFYSHAVVCPARRRDTDPSLPQRFLLHRIAAASLPGWCPVPWVFERVGDAAVGVHQGEVDALDFSDIMSYITDNVSRRADR